MKFDVPASGTAPAGLWVGLSDGGRFDTTRWATWHTSKDIKVLAGDFNGDGRTDVMKFDVPASGTAPAGLWVGLSDGGRFDTTRWGIWDTSKDIKVLAGDFNGDGMIDVMKFDVPASGMAPMDLQVGLSTGYSFGKSRWGNWWTWKEIEVLAGDFNGDRKTDVMKVDLPEVPWITRIGGLWVGISNVNNNSFNTTEWGRTLLPPKDKTKFLTGDFNGDGRVDVMMCRIHLADLL
jgi:hypothetical protein